MSLSIHLARLFSKYNWLGYPFGMLPIKKISEKNKRQIPEDGEMPFIMIKIVHF